MFARTLVDSKVIDPQPHYPPQATIDDDGKVWLDGKPFDPAMVTESDPVIPHKDRPESDYGMPEWIPTPHELELMTPEEFDKTWVNYFNHPDCDKWMARKGVTDVYESDVIPDPSIVKAALLCARRNDDIIFAIRTMEVFRYKCNIVGKEYWPYMWQEIKDTVEELGLPSLEAIGFDKPDPKKPILRGQ